MNTVVKILAGAALIALGGCATVIKGTTQEIIVETNPQGASCTVSRGNAQIAILNPTPGTVQVSRSKDSLTFACSKPPQYSSASTQIIESTFNGATIGNILLGGVIGVAVDASTGANNNYPEKVMIDLAGSTPAVTSTDLPSPAGASAPATSSTMPTSTMKPVADEEPAKPAKKTP